MGNYFYPIVDGENTEIGSVLDESYLEKGNVLHRGVQVFIDVKGGGFVVQCLPEGSGYLYTSPVIGHVKSGESYGHAALRLLVEQTGLLPIDESDLVNESILPASSLTRNEFLRLYSFLMDPSVEYLSPKGDRNFLTIPLNKLIEDIDMNMPLYDPLFVNLINIFLSYSKGVEECQPTHNQLQKL